MFFISMQITREWKILIMNMQIKKYDYNFTL